NRHPPGVGRRSPPPAPAMDHRESAARGRGRRRGAVAGRLQSALPDSSRPARCSAAGGNPPAWLAAGTDPQEALAEGGARSGVPTGPGPGRSRARDLLIVGEVAVSVLLTIAAVAIPRSPVKHRLLSQVARRPAKPARRGIGRSGQRRAAF